MPWRLAWRSVDFVAALFGTPGVAYLGPRGRAGPAHALSRPDLDLRLAAASSPGRLAPLSRLALHRARDQLLFRIPLGEPECEPLLDMALVTPLGALAVPSHRLWRGRSSWWAIPAGRRIRHFHLLSERGLTTSLHPPFASSAEEDEGRRVARAAFVEAVTGGSDP